MDAAKTERKGPLTDLRVIELGQLIAGPFCGQLFADMGADVIKVEPPGRGDPMRVWGRDGYPMWWSVCARNKRCMTLDLRQSEGQEMIKQLVKDADFILENFRPGTMEKWGLGYDVLKEINPGLIMIRVSGYGQSGPYSNRPGYASVGEAMGGIRYLMGEPDRKPSRAGISLGDSLAATYATVGALAALHHREKTGEGQVIDATIYESCLQITEGLIGEYFTEGYTRERTGSYLPGIAPSNIYETTDGMVIVAANQDTIFKRLCEAMGTPELADDPRYATHVARGENQIELDAIISEWTKVRGSAEVEHIMIEHAVPVGKIYRAKDMLEDPHYAARKAIIDMPSERFGDLKMQGVFPKMSKTQGEVRWAGPDELGAHTEEILTEVLDLTPEQITKLRQSGIV
jgi:crotonobetainyl-CoA:carnitine CoA-transferase CaiB-like acyl-CoA transferase